jgi:hypothetical protein
MFKGWDTSAQKSDTSAHTGVNLCSRMDRFRKYAKGELCEIERVPTWVGGLHPFLKGGTTQPKSRTPQPTFAKTSVLE